MCHHHLYLLTENLILSAFCLKEILINPLMFANLSQKKTNTKTNYCRFFSHWKEPPKSKSCFLSKKSFCFNYNNTYVHTEKMRVSLKSLTTTSKHLIKMTINNTINNIHHTHSFIYNIFVLDKLDLFILFLYFLYPLISYILCPTESTR